ncbi:MAG: CPBP family intramembrane metalloprotease [Puniceicoccales bacterium]|jgi:membrane protease YdiL (CAAX protease family)|nr:CPBP family intramembrane metalloprotease [Puniceicoccales bacterium]
MIPDFFIASLTGDAPGMAVQAWQGALFLAGVATLALLARAELQKRRHASRPPEHSGAAQAAQGWDTDPACGAITWPRGSQGLKYFLRTVMATLGTYFFVMVFLVPFTRGAGEVVRATLMTIAGQMAVLVVLLLFPLFQNPNPGFRYQAGGWRPPWFPHGLWHPLPAFAGGLALTSGVSLAQMFLDKVLARHTGITLGLDKAQDVVMHIANARDNPAHLLAMGVSVVILAPLTEELFFRGIVYPFAKSRMGALPGALLTGVIFGAIHASATAFLPLAVFGVFLCLVYERTRDIRAVVLVHALFNLNTFLLLLAGLPPNP